MGFRAPLDIERYAARVGVNTTTGEVRRAPVIQELIEEEEPSDKPRMVGLYIHVEASTSTTLTITPEIVWDVNYYYRVHGFMWPYRVSTREIRLAHHARGGIDDPYMTTAMLALRDPKRRRVYDSQPLGEPIMDSYFVAWMKAQAHRKSAYLRKYLGVDMNPEQVLESLGFGTDGVSAAQKPSSTPSESLSEGPDTVPPPWSWSYYQLGTTCDDVDRLGRWQEMLVRAFGRVGVARRFGVGVMGRQPQQWHSREVFGRLVIFFDEHTEPTDELAAQAVAAL